MQLKWYQLCGQDHILWDRGLIKTLRPRLHKKFWGQDLNIVTETQYFQIRALCRKFSQKYLHHFQVEFF